MNAPFSVATFDRIPDELKRLGQWVGWRFEHTDQGKPTKVPYNVRAGYHASTTDPQTWAPFADAVAAVAAGHVHGIGFVFTEGDDYAGIDLDTPYDPETGESLLHPIDGARQQSIFQAMNSYSERSPSGRGLHIIVKASVPHGRKRASVELYSSLRFFTFTGDVFHDAPIADRQELVQILWSELGGQATPNYFVGDLAETQSDDQIIQAARSARNGELFIQLWHGDASGYPSPSEADLALVDIISFYTKHRGQIERLFLASALGKRDKYTQVKPARLAALLGYMVNKSFDRMLPPVDLSLLSFRAGQTEPQDLWGTFDPPTLPTGLLPPVLEAFAREHGDQMGADPGGLAMAALATCAAAICDGIEVQVQVHNAHWRESARIWVALVADPSGKKSPQIRAATRRLASIDHEQAKEFDREKVKYDALDKEARQTTPEPCRRRIVVRDITVEKLQDILVSSPNGVLVLQDELAGWIGGIDKYSGSKGGSHNRSFWLEAFNGGANSFDRVGRGSGSIPNQSASILGGIQPSTIRQVAADGVDDGLLQRFLFVVLQPAGLTMDQPRRNIVGEYEALIDLLHRQPPLHLRFDAEAQAIRNRAEEHHHRLLAWESVNPKLATHIGKYDGIFARLCVIWHVVENASWQKELPTFISGDVAARVERFLHSYVLKHALAFYTGIIGVTDDDAVGATAGYILTRPEIGELSFRDVARGDGNMRALDRYQATKVLEKLEYLGWLFQQPGPRPSSPPRWLVNPQVHRLFGERAKRERERREAAKQVIAETLRGR